MYIYDVFLDNVQFSSGKKPMKGTSLICFLQYEY